MPAVLCRIQQQPGLCCRLEWEAFPSLSWQQLMHQILKLMAKLTCPTLCHQHQLKASQRNAVECVTAVVWGRRRGCIVVPAAHTQGSVTPHAMLSIILDVTGHMVTRRTKHGHHSLIELLFRFGNVKYRKICKHWEVKEGGRHYFSHV